MPRGYPTAKRIARAAKLDPVRSTLKPPVDEARVQKALDALSTVTKPTEPRFAAIFEFDGLKRTYVCETYFDLLVLKDALQKRYGMGTVRTEGEPR